MKITRRQLRQIIKEAIQLVEGEPGPRSSGHGKGYKADLRNDADLTEAF